MGGDSWISVVYHQTGALPSSPMAAMQPKDNRWVNSDTSNVYYAGRASTSGIHGQSPPEIKPIVERPRRFSEKWMAIG